LLRKKTPPCRSSLGRSTLSFLRESYGPLCWCVASWARARGWGCFVSFAAIKIEFHVNRRAAHTHFRPRRVGSSCTFEFRWAPEPSSACTFRNIFVPNRRSKSSNAHVNSPLAPTSTTRPHRTPHAGYFSCGTAAAFCSCSNAAIWCQGVSEA
jgi:hypothetical protein